MESSCRTVILSNDNWKSSQNDSFPFFRFGEHIFFCSVAIRHCALHLPDTFMSTSHRHYGFSARDIVGRTNVHNIPSVEHFFFNTQNTHANVSMQTNETKASQFFEKPRATPLKKVIPKIKLKFKHQKTV